MNIPTIYTATPDDLSPPVQSESFCVDVVLAADYRELEEKYQQLAAESVALAAENKKAVDAVTVFSNVTHDITEIICEEIGLDRVAEIVAAYNDLGNMPATDRIVAGIKADGVEEFIGRLQQCVDDGDFVGDEVAVIVGAIDCGKEFCEQQRKGLSGEFRIPLYTAPPAPVVGDHQIRERQPVEMDEPSAEDYREMDDEAYREDCAYAAGWNACRAAMLQAQPDDDGEPTDDERIIAIEGIIPPISSGNSPVIPGAEQRITDAVDLLKQAAPAMLADNGGPDGPLAGRMKSQVVPGCWCRTCRPVVWNDMRFVVCPDCGNKRCPRANDHRNACSGSNKPGQEGSAYPAAPQSPGSDSATVPTKWIPVSERMPEKNQSVLISVNFDSSLVEPLICSARYTGSTFRRGDATVKPGSGIEQATHWMPLPAAPQELKP